MKKETQALSHIKILNWAEEDRPREKLLLKGKSTLSDAELIGILIGSGTFALSAVDLGKQILQSVDNNLNELAKLSVKDLEKFKGIGEAKAITIVSALELGRRRKEAEVPKKTQIKHPQDVHTLMIPYLLDLPYEEFWILLLNRANIVIKPVKISSGGVQGTVVDAKIIFKHALENLASGIVLVHNHPSGSLQPSQADLQITKKLQQAGQVLEIPILDHIIFADKAYFSFNEKNLL